MPASTTKKIFVAFALVGILLISSPLAMAVVPSAAAQVSFPTIIESGSMVSDASYIVFTDGNNYFAKNGTTGAIDYRSDNAAGVIQYAIDNGNSVFIKNEIYTITETIRLDNNTVLMSDGAKLVSAYDDLWIMNSRPKLFDRSWAPLTNLTVDSSKMDHIITVASSENIRVGDYLEIHSDKGWYGRSDHDGEIITVASISGNDITVEGALRDYYLVSDNARLYPLNMIHNITVSGLAFVGKTNTANGVGLSLAQVERAVVENCYFSSNGYIGLSISDSKDITVRDIVSERQNREGLGYGIDIWAGSENVAVYDSTFRWCRHGMTNGQATYGIPRDILFQNCRFIENDATQQHSCGEYISYVNCEFHNEVVAIVTPNGLIDDCSFFTPRAYNSLTMAIADNTQIINSHFYAKEKLSGTAISIESGNNITLQGNEFRYDTYVSGNTRAIYIVPSKAMSDLKILSNVVYSENIGIHISSSYPMRNVIVDGNTVYSKSIGIYVQGPIDIDITSNYVNNPSSTSITIDGNREPILISGNTLISPKASAILAVSTKNITITNNQIECLVTTSAGAIYLYGTDALRSMNGIVSMNNINMFGVGRTGIRIGVYANNYSVVGNIILGQYDNGVSINGNDVEDIIVSGTLTTGMTAVGTSGIVTRIVINGVGTNGAFDPDIGGEWKGYAYEGLFVTWTDGSGNKTMSCYRGGSWLDWMVS